MSSNDGKTEVTSNVVSGGAFSSHTQLTRKPPVPPPKSGKAEVASPGVDLFRVPKEGDAMCWPDLFSRGSPCWGFPLIENKEVDAPSLEVQASRRVIQGREAYYDVFDHPIYFFEEELPDCFIPVTGIQSVAVHLNRGPVRKKGVDWPLKVASEYAGTAYGAVESMRMNGYNNAQILEQLGDRRNEFISALPENDILRGTLFLSAEGEREFFQTWFQLLSIGEYTIQDFQESLDYLKRFKEGEDVLSEVEDYGSGLEYLDELRKNFPELGSNLTPAKVSFKETQGEIIFYPDGYCCPVEYKHSASIMVPAGSASLFINIDPKLQDALDSLFEFERKISVFKVVPGSAPMLEKMPENARLHKTAANENSQGRKTIIAGRELWREVQKDFSGYLFQVSTGDERDDRINLILFYLSLLYDGARNWTQEFLRSPFAPVRGDLNPRALENNGWDSNFYPSASNVVEKENLLSKLDRVEMELKDGVPRFAIERCCRPESSHDTLVRAWINRGPSLNHILFSQIDFENRAVMIDEQKSGQDILSAPLFYLYRMAAYNFKPNAIDNFYPSRIFPTKGKLSIERAKTLSFNTQFLCYIKFELGYELRCVYCGEAKPLLGPEDKSKGPRMSADHMVPSSQVPDWQFDARDLIPMCSSCNSVKGTEKFSLLKVSTLVSDPFVEFAPVPNNGLSKLAQITRMNSSGESPNASASVKLKLETVKIPLAKLEVKDQEFKAPKQGKRLSSSSENSLSDTPIAVGKTSLRIGKKLSEGVYQMDKQLLAQQAAVSSLELGEGVFHFSHKKIFLPYKGTKGFLTKFTPQLRALYNKVRADYGINHMVVDLCSAARVIPLHADQHELLASNYIYRCVQGEVRQIRFERGFNLTPEEGMLYRFNSDLGKHSVPSGGGTRVSFTFRTLKEGAPLKAEPKTLSLDPLPSLQVAGLKSAAARARSKSRSKSAVKGKDRKPWGEASDSEVDEKSSENIPKPRFEIEIDPKAIVGTFVSTDLKKVYDSGVIIHNNGTEVKTSLVQQTSDKYNNTVSGVLPLKKGRNDLTFSKDSFALYLPNKKDKISYEGRILPGKRCYPLVSALEVEEDCEVLVIYDSIVYVEYFPTYKLIGKQQFPDWLCSGPVLRDPDKTMVAKSLISEVFRGLEMNSFEKISIASVSAPLEKWSARKWTDKSFIKAQSKYPWKEIECMAVLTQMSSPWGFSLKVDSEGHNLRAGGEPWMKYIICSRIKNVT